MHPQFSAETITLMKSLLVADVETCNRYFLHSHGYGDRIKQAVYRNSSAYNYQNMRKSP